MTKKDVLCEQQNGFRTNKTSSSALMDSVEERTTENNQVAVGGLTPADQRNSTFLGIQAPQEKKSICTVSSF